MGSDRCRIVVTVTVASCDTESGTRRHVERGPAQQHRPGHRTLGARPGRLPRLLRRGCDADRCAHATGRHAHLSAEDVALGYKQLLAVERGWRDTKQILDLRPVHHRLEDRIRAHVLLCWLALCC